MSQAFSNNQNSFNVATIANTFNYNTPYDRSEILEWLSPLEPRVRHRDIGARRIDSIGTRLLETEEFKCWHNGSREDRSYPTLFCDGNPGVGKSYNFIMQLRCSRSPQISSGSPLSHAILPRSQGVLYTHSLYRHPPFFPASFAPVRLT